MFSRKSNPEPRVITPDEEDLIIWNYLNKIAPAYKDQDISAETMIQMEKSMIVARTSEPSIIAECSIPNL